MRRILITGASRGIGKKIAEKAYDDGHFISLGVRNLDALKNTKLSTSTTESKRVLISKYEASEKISANKLVDQTINCFGKIDTLIHCAGIFRSTGLNFKDNEEKEINNLININLMGPWYLTRAAWEHLIKCKNGRIIILISMSGKRSKGNLAGYTASKFALMGLSQTIRNEGWENGIRVTTISPSWVNTDMASSISKIKKEEMTQPEDIAELASTILKLPNSCIPFDISVNCNLEK